MKRTSETRASRRRGGASRGRGRTVSPTRFIAHLDELVRQVPVRPEVRALGRHDDAPRAGASAVLCAYCRGGQKMRQTGAPKSRDSPAVECLSLSSELPLLTRHNRGRFARRLASTRERSPRSRTRVRHARANSRSVPAAASRAFVASSRRSRGRRSRTSNLSFKRPGLETGPLAARPRPRTPRDDRRRGARVVRGAGG